MPIITRRIRALSFEELFLHAFRPFLPERLCPLGPKPFEGFLPSVPALSEQERTIVLVHASVAETTGSS